MRNTVIGGVTGAVGLSLLLHLAVYMWSPKTLGDGQYGMVFFLTVPVGAFLGAALTSGLRPKEQQGSLSRGASILGGGCIAIVIGFAVLYTFAIAAALIFGNK